MPPFPVQLGGTFRDRCVSHRIAGHGPSASGGGVQHPGRGLDQADIATLLGGLILRLRCTLARVPDGDGIATLRLTAHALDVAGIDSGRLADSELVQAERLYDAFRIRSGLPLPDHGLATTFQVRLLHHQNRGRVRDQLRTPGTRAVFDAQPGKCDVHGVALGVGRIPQTVPPVVVPNGRSQGATDHGLILHHVPQSTGAGRVPEAIGEHSTALVLVRIRLTLERSGDGHPIGVRDEHAGSVCLTVPADGPDREVQVTGPPHVPEPFQLSGGRVRP